MASILDLPSELLHSIFEFLPPQQLPLACVVCNAFRTVAEPRLYSRIEMVWHSSATPPIIPLLRSILRRPELASHVRTLVLSGNTDFYRVSFGGKLPPKIQVDVAQLDMLVVAVEGFNVSFDKELWIREMRAGTMDAFITLLLSKLSNLRALHILNSFAKETRLLGMMLRSCLCNSPDSGVLCRYHFQHLRDVSFIPLNDDGRNPIMHNPADVLPLFYLPSVRCLSASINNPASFSWPANEPDPAQLISLDLTTIREAHLGHILKQTKALQSLRWQWFYDDNAPDQYNTPTIDFDQFSSALSHVRNTLTELRISATAFPRVGRGDIDLPLYQLQGSLHFIRDFHKLRVFEAPYTLLLGLTMDDTKRLQDVIPRYAQFVTISADLINHESNEWWQEEDVIEVIRLWLENFPEATPCLRGLTLSLEELFMGIGWGPELRSQLADLCAKVGIRFDVEKLTPRKKHGSNTQRV